MYHDGNRSLQDRFDSRRIADRLVEVLHRERFTAEDREFIEGRSMFFLATADAGGWPDCSYKGGQARVRARDFGRHACVPELRRQRHVQERRQPSREPARRDAVHGLRKAEAPAGQRHARRSISQDPLLGSFDGAQLVVRVRAAHIFPNCPRYIHRMALEEISVYAPAAGHEPPTPAWKEMEAFRDYLPRPRPDDPAVD